MLRGMADPSVKKKRWTGGPVCLVVLLLTACAPQHTVTSPGELTREGTILHMKPYLAVGAMTRLNALWTPEIQRVTVQGT